jgi:hypothetical protein
MEQQAIWIPAVAILVAIKLTRITWNSDPWPWVFSYPRSDSKSPSKIFGNAALETLSKGKIKSWQFYSISSDVV